MTETAIVVAIIIALVVAAAAAVLGWALARGRSQKLLAGARAEARRSESEAAEMAELTRREGEARRREQQEQLERAWRDEQAVLAEELRVLGELVERKQARLVQREQQLELRVASFEQAQDQLAQSKQQAREVRGKAKEIRSECKKKLEHQAGLTSVEAVEHLVERLVEDTREDCADRLRNLEHTGADEFGRMAKRVMGIAMQRYGGHCARERAAMTMALAPGAATKLQGSAADDVARVAELARVNFSFADDGSSVRLESSDGVARELARRTLARLVADDGVRDPEALLHTIRDELDREIRDTGKKAFRQLRVKQSAPEVVELIGKLNYRTSYTQNQWRHAIEAGQLAGMMAEELGLDSCLARRAALMHDIGKALTHEVEGSHALIGADLARQAGEPELVANAIGHHHGEEPSQSAYAPLVAAADAMSGGRPGARREMVESYGDRIGDLERIAGDFEGVIQAHAVQAGRELRVHVDEDRVSDEQLAALSSAIAQAISTEMTFPGQIRVTVIREFCAVEYAS